MDLTAFQALTFDVYGTLIDWETGIADALAPWAERNGVPADRAQLLGAFARHETTRQQENPDTRYADVLELVFADIAGDFGVKPTRADAYAFGESVQEWPAFDDAAEALKRLQTRYRLGVISNVDRASFVMSQAKLGVNFDLQVTAEDAEAYKPDPAPFEMALDWLNEIGIGFDAILHVAQSPYHDHVPAKALAMTTCWIDRQGLAQGGAWGATPEVPDRPRVDATFPSLAALADAAGV
ncbi:MAG: HAD-IA family hydrolase [Rhodovibrio sp.]|nr:HAD-IA family hydrolase [Rhodovibrio sp.]